MGMIERISEAEAVRDFSAVLERVRSQGVTIEIVNGSAVVARLEPPTGARADASEQKSCTIDQFVELWKRLPRLDPEDAAAFEADLIAIRKEFPMQEREWD